LTDWSKVLHCVFKTFLENIYLLMQLNCECCSSLHLNFINNIIFFINLDLTSCLMCWYLLKTKYQRYMLQERKTESIYREIVISKMRLKRRFASYHIADIFFTWLYIEVRILITVVFLSTQAMAEKIERMELVSESKDKVCFIKSFALFFPSFHAQKSV